MRHDLNMRAFEVACANKGFSNLELSRAASMPLSTVLLALRTGRASSALVKAFCAALEVSAETLLALDPAPAQVAAAGETGAGS